MIMINFLKPNFTVYAVERSRYNIIQGLKYWRLVKSDPTSKVYLLKHYPPNANRDMSRAGGPESAPYTQE